MSVQCCYGNVDQNIGLFGLLFKAVSNVYPNVYSNVYPEFYGSKIVAHFERARSPNDVALYK